MTVGTHLVWKGETSMTHTMKAAVLKAAKSKVEIEERKRPMPGRGEVLIHVRVCGVCHGDV